MLIGKICLKHYKSLFRSKGVNQVICSVCGKDVPNVSETIFDSLVCYECLELGFDEELDFDENDWNEEFDEGGES